jgi:hypothetical protein
MSNSPIRLHDVHRDNLTFLYGSDYQAGVRTRTFKGPQKKLSNGGKRNINGLFIYSYNTQIWNNSNYINYKHFTNMKGTIYGNGLPRSTQVKEGWEPLLCGILYAVA